MRVAQLSPVLADVPNPIGIITDGLGAAGGWAFDKVAEGIAKWILGAVEFFVNGSIDFLRTSSTPDPTAAWFSGTGSPYAAVRNVAALLLAGFVFLGIVQGLIRGDTGAMLRRIVGGLPAAVAGMVITTTVVWHLLALTDAMSAAVLENTDEQALHFLSGFGASVTGVTTGFAAVLLGLIAAIAGLLLWIELIVRASLIYVLVAISPLAFAAILWPATRGTLRRTVELLLAVVFSKLVISIALAIGVAALSGAGTAGTAGAGLASNAGAGLGGLLVGAVLLGLAAFSPFIVLKLVPVAEAAIVAQGVSRSPVRATQSGISAANSASNLKRIAGSGSGRASAPALRAAGPAQGASAGGGAAAAAGPVGAAVAAPTVAVAAGARAARKVADTTNRSADSPAERQAGSQPKRDDR
jgi:hypothetical protein